MTTAAQVKRAMKPLIEKYPDLALVGRAIFLKPVRHLVHSVIIDRTGSAEDFRPYWAINETFDIRRSIGLSWGREIYPPQKGLWLWSDPTSIPTLLTIIEGEALPRLRAFQTIAQVVEALPDLDNRYEKWSKPPLEFWPDRKIVFEVALGDLTSARAIAAKMMQYWVAPPAHFKAWDREQWQRLVMLARLLDDDDRAGLAALLHEWEHTTVRNLRIEHLWEPTPFPLEIEPVR